MKYLKRLVLLLAVISLAGCAYNPKLILLPVERYQFITKTGDTLARVQQKDKIELPVDGVWMSIGEKNKYEDAQVWAVQHGYKPQ